MRGLRKLRKHVDAWSVECVLPERPAREEAGRHHARLMINGIPELRLTGPQGLTWLIGTEEVWRRASPTAGGDEVFP